MMLTSMIAGASMLDTHQETVPSIDRRVSPDARFVGESGAGSVERGTLHRLFFRSALQYFFVIVDDE